MKALFFDVSECILEIVEAEEGKELITQQGFNAGVVQRGPKGDLYLSAAGRNLFALDGSSLGDLVAMQILPRAAVERVLRNKDVVGWSPYRSPNCPTCGKDGVVNVRTTHLYAEPERVEGREGRGLYGELKKREQKIIESTHLFECRRCGHRWSKVEYHK